MGKQKNLYKVAGRSKRKNFFLNQGKKEVAKVIRLKRHYGQLNKNKTVSKKKAVSKKEAMEDPCIHQKK